MVVSGFNVMPCYHPWLAYQCLDGSVVSVERKGKGAVVRTLTLPCGQCVGCRLERSRQWAIRCMHEAQLHERNSFVTLTYKGDVPDEGLRYRDFQLFMKRLRKYASGQQIRFYMCGEYGDEKGRPHFHACLFGVVAAVSNPYIGCPVYTISPCVNCLCPACVPYVYFPVVGSTSPSTSFTVALLPIGSVMLSPFCGSGKQDVK